MHLSSLSLRRGTWMLALAGLAAACGGDDADAGAKASDPLPAELRPILPGAIERGSARGRLAQGAFVDATAPADASWGGVTVEARTLAGAIVGTTTAAPDGSFSLEKLPTGLIRLQAQQGATVARADATIVPGVSVEVNRVFPVTRQQAASAAAEGAPGAAIVAGTMNPLPAGVVLYPAAMPDGAMPVEKTRKTLGAEAYLFFVDASPTTQYGHPVQYVLVDAASGAVERIDGHAFLPVVNHGKPWRSLDSLVALPFDVSTTLPADYPPDAQPAVSPEFAQLPPEIPLTPGEKTVDQQPLPLSPAGSIAEITAQDGAKMPTSGLLSHFNNTGSDGVFVVLIGTSSESAFEQNASRMGRWLYLEGVPLSNMARANLARLPTPTFQQTGENQTDRINRQAAVARQIQRATLHFEPQIRARLDQGKHSTLIVYLTGHGGPSGLNVDFLGDESGSFIAEAGDLGLEKSLACRVRVIIQSCQSGGFQDAIASHLTGSGHDLQIFAAADRTKYAEHTPGWVSYIPVVNLLRQGGSAYTKELVEEVEIANGDLAGLTETLADGSIVQAEDMRELNSLPPPPFLRPAHPAWCFPGEGAGGAGGSGTSPTGGMGGAPSTEPSVRLDYDLIPGELKAGDLVALSRIMGGHVSEQDQGCSGQHYHAGGEGIRIDGKGPFADKAPSGCGFGRIVGP